MCNKYCAITAALIAFLVVNQMVLAWYLDLENMTCTYHGNTDPEWWVAYVYISSFEMAFSVILASAVWGCGIVAIARERRGDIITAGPAPRAEFIQLE